MPKGSHLGALAGFPDALKALIDASPKSISQIADEVGISRSTFYRYFEGKIFPGIPTFGRILEAIGKDAVDFTEALAKAQGLAPTRAELEAALRLFQLRLGGVLEEPGDGSSYRKPE